MKGTALAAGNPNATQVGLEGGWTKRKRWDSSSPSSDTSTTTNTSAVNNNTGAVSSNTAATEANTEAKKEEESIASKLAGLYDWVAVKLEYFGRETERIANRINDYISSALKTSLLRRQISAVEKEIDVNSRAARVYRQQAEKVATDTGMSADLVKKAKSGEWLFENLSDEDEEKVSTFLQYYDKFRDAEDNVQSLREEQLKLFDDWANMPIEKAKERVDRYSESMERLGNAYSLVENGQSTLSAYLKTFKGRPEDQLNSAQAIARANASRRPYTVLNPLLDEQLKEQNNTVKANRVSYKEASENLAQAEKLQKKAKKNANEAKKKAEKRGNWLLGQDFINNNLSSSQKNSLKKGKTVDTTGITDGNTLDAIKKYNKLVQLADTANENATQSAQNYNIALSRQKEAYSNVADSEAEYAEMVVENEKKKFANIQSYYESIISYREALVDNAASSRSIKEAYGQDTEERDYLNEINQLQKQRNATDQEQLRLQEQLNDSLASGKIKKGSQEYYELLGEILALNDSLVDTDASIVKLQDEMRDTIILREYEKQMEKSAKTVDNLNASIKELTSTSQLLSSGRSALDAYLRTIEKYSKGNETGIQAFLANNKNRRTYVTQNKLLDKELKQEGKLLKQYGKDYEVATQTVDKARAQSRADRASARKADKALDKQRNAILGNESITGNLTKAQIDAIKNGETVNANGIKDKSTLTAIHAYNSAVANSGKKNEAARKSADKYTESVKNQKDALNTVTEQEIKYASTLVKNEQEKFSNIQNYYDQLIQYRDTIAGQYSSQRSLKSAFREDLTKSDYTNEINAMEKKRNEQIKERNALILQFNKSVASGAIKKGSLEYLAMEETIRSMNTDIDNTTSSIIKLQDEMRDTTILGKINEAIEEATKNVGKFKSTLSSITTVIDAVSSGASAFEQYSQVLASIHGTNPKDLTDEQKIIRNTHKDRAYVGQNQLLDLQTKAQKDIMTATKKELKEINTLVSTANTEQKNANNAASKANKTLEARKKSLLSQKDIISGLNKTQIDALKKGEAISTTGITSKKVLDAVTKYNALVTDAKTKNEDAKHAADVYDTALENQKTTMGELRSAEADYATMLVENERKKLDNISAYYESISSYTSTLAESRASERKLKEAYGEDTVKADYTNQIYQLERQRAALEKEQELLRESFNKSVDSGIIEVGSQEYYEMKQQVVALDSAINNITDSILNLQDEMRNEIFYRALNKALETAEELRDALSSISGIIKDEMMFDDNGDITGIGITNLAMQVKEYESALGSLSTLMKKRDQYIKNYNNGINTTNYNAKEFEKDMDNITKEIQSMLGNADKLRTAITDMMAKTSKAELDAVFKVIDARSELLRKQKEYYDYDKTLKGKTNDLQALDAQLRALEGIDDLETKAMRRRLEEQRADLQEDLDETVKEHAYELQIAGLDDLKVELQENYENYVNDLNGNLTVITSAVKDATKTVTQSLGTVNQTVTTLLSAYNKGLTGEIVGVPKYASGTKYVNRDTYGLTNERGGEIAITKRGVFMPLPKGSGVIPSYLTSNLFGLAENYSQIMSGIGNDTPSLVAPVVTSNVTINGTNLSEQDLVRAMNAHVREMSKQIQNDIRKDLVKSR